MLHLRRVVTSVPHGPSTQVRWKNAAALMSDVHGTTHGKKHWRNRPLFRRGGDKKFRNGQEASEMLMDEAQRRDPNQDDFLEAVGLFLDSVEPVFDRYPKYAWVMKTLMEPERVIQFRVPWIDESGNMRVNRGFRVQFSSSLGPFIGGLRFHPSNDLSTAKFLGFEGVFRNALAGSFGAAHGGADFNPVDKSEAEVMRFCQSYMTELANYIGPHTDTPTAGVGVGFKEIGYMFGQYKRLRQLNPAGAEGILSGGVHYYPQAVGHGVVHFANEVLQSRGESLKGKRCLISGSGIVAISVAEKLLEYGAVPIGMSDYFGYVIEPEGFTSRNVKDIMSLKEDRNARLGGYVMTSTSAQYYPAEEGSVWDTPCDYAFPCAIQNDITGDVAKKLIQNGCQGVFEGANMPCDGQAIEMFRQQDLAYAPNKASNSGSVALAAKNLGNTELSAEELDAIVKEYMQDVFKTVSATAADFNMAGNLNAGVNITGFMRVANAMFRQGVV